MEKKEQPIKRNPVSDTDLKEEILDQWDPVKDAKEAEEIQRNLEAVPDTEEWNPTEEKFQALMQKARERGFHISSDEGADDHTDDFDDSKKENAKEETKEKTKKETTITYPTSRRAAGWWRKKAIQWTAVAAVTAIGIFGVSMTSQANRAYVMQEVHKVFGNDVNTEIDNVDVAMSDRTEEYAKEEIESTLDIQMPRFFYLPEGLEYVGYTIDEDSHTAFMQYTYDEELVHFMIVANDEGAAVISQNDSGKKICDIQNDYNPILSAELWEIMDDEDNNETFTLQWNYLNVHYELLGKFSEQEFVRMAEQIMY